MLFFFKADVSSVFVFFFKSLSPLLSFSLDSRFFKGGIAKQYCTVILRIFWGFFLYSSSGQQQKGLETCGLPWWLSSKEPACQCRRCGRGCRFNPWVGKIPWRRKWQPPPVFLPRKFQEQRSLVGYSPRGQSQTWLSNWMATAAGDLKILQNFLEEMGRHVMFS